MKEKKMNKPLISVVIPAYNREKTIKNAIRSVLNQNYKELEILVVDDGSTDNTSNVVKSINDSRVKYIYQKNQGACAARNNGIIKASGRYIAFHDSDDIWHADKLAKQLPVLFDKKADIVFCKLNITDGKENNEKYPSYYDEGIVEPINTLLGIGTQTLVMRADLAKQNLFDTKMPRFQELEFLIRVVPNNKIYCVDEPLVDYIIGDDSISKSHGKLINALKIIIKKYPNIKIQYPEMAKQFSNMLTGVAESYKNADAIDLLHLAQKYHTNWKTTVKISLAQMKLFNAIVKIKNNLKKG